MRRPNRRRQRQPESLSLPKLRKLLKVESFEIQRYNVASDGPAGHADKIHKCLANRADFYLRTWFAPPQPFFRKRSPRPSTKSGCPDLRRNSGRIKF